jgi:shikimate dehydrogenase
VIACATIGADVVIASRRDEESRRLVAEVHRGEATDWATLASIRAFDLVINATSAGMSGAEAGQAIADAFARAPRTNDAVAYDLVYRAPSGESTTSFLARAAALGHRGVDGLGMLVEQGMRALSLFLGGARLESNVRSVMRRAVQDALGRSPDA